MLSVRPSDARGHSQLDWLDSRHTFSFDQYHDPQHMSFGPLRVINEDVIAAGGGFGTHPHRDMEIITYVIEGQLAHKDSMGTGSIIGPGEIQKMSAGKGIFHSEFNVSSEKPVHLLQIWIMPNIKGLAPSYEQQKFDLKPGEFKLLGSPDGQGLVSIHQNVKLYAVRIDAGNSATFKMQPSAKAWVQIVKGECTVNSIGMNAGDGAGVQPIAQIQFNANKSASCEALLFEIQ